MACEYVREPGETGFIYGLQRLIISEICGVVWLHEREKKLPKMWKKTVVPSFEVQSRYFRVRTEVNHEDIQDLYVSRQRLEPGISRIRVERSAAPINSMKGTVISQTV